ncbi:MAG: hypothetical protein ACYCQM_14030 [Acidithiobacillus sp.]
MASIFDRPVAAIVSEHLCGIGALRAMAGESVGRLCRELITAAFIGDIALNGKNLPHTGEIEVIIQAGGEPDRALSNAAMSKIGCQAEIGFGTPRKNQSDGLAQRGLILFGRKDVVGLMFEDISGYFAPGQ